MCQGSWSFFATRLVLYESRLSVLRGIMEIVFLMLWVYQVQKEVKRCYHTHPRVEYFLQTRNLFEILFLSMNMGLIVSWIRVVADHDRRFFDVNRTTYINLFPLSYNFLVSFSFAAFTALLACLKLFKVGVSLCLCVSVSLCLCVSGQCLSWWLPLSFTPCVFACARVSQFMSVNKRMSTLWVTLQRASYDLGVFLVGFVIILVGFGVGTCRL